MLQVSGYVSARGLQVNPEFELRTLNSIGIAAEDSSRADNQVNLIKYLRYRYEDGLRS